MLLLSTQTCSGLIINMILNAYLKKFFISLQQNVYFSLCHVWSCKEKHWSIKKSSIFRGIAVLTVLIWSIVLFQGDFYKIVFMKIIGSLLNSLLQFTYGDTSVSQVQFYRLWLFLKTFKSVLSKSVKYVILIKAASFYVKKMR